MENTVQSPTLQSLTRELTVGIEVQGETERCLHEVAAILTKSCRPRVLIHGPSCSGKTTLVHGLPNHPSMTARRIVQLKVAAMREAERNHNSPLRIICSALQIEKDTVLVIDEAQALFGQNSETSADEAFSYLTEVDCPVVVAMSSDAYKCWSESVSKHRQRLWHVLEMPKIEAGEKHN